VAVTKRKRTRRDALLAKLVKKYVRDYRDHRDRLGLKALLMEFSRLPTPKDVVHHAALGHRLGHKKRDGTFKRHPHQRLIPMAVLRKSERNLQTNLPALLGAKTFDVLKTMVAAAIPVKNKRGLLVYDTTVRIWAGFARQPPEQVDLDHGHTAKGARALGLRGKMAERTAFPLALQELNSFEIEDFLCIYADEIPAA
jgi:hypothetical protein